MVLDRDVLQHEGGHVQAFLKRLDSRKKDFLAELHIAVVAGGQVVGEEGEFVGDSLNAVAASPDDFENVGIFFVRHDAGPGGEGIREADEAKILVHVQADIVGQFGQGSRDGGHRGGGGFFRFAPGHLRVHDVVVHGGESKQARGCFPL